MPSRAARMAWAWSRWAVPTAIREAVTGTPATVRSLYEIVPR